MSPFKKKFLKAIRAGEKTQSIRLWKHRNRQEVGQDYQDLQDAEEGKKLG